MHKNGPSFAERTKLLKDIAVELVRLSDIVGDEAERMQAAQERFSARRAPRETANR
jgi:hypothetical protein